MNVFNKFWNEEGRYVNTLGEDELRELCQCVYDLSKVENDQLRTENDKLKKRVGELEVEEMKYIGLLIIIEKIDSWEANEKPSDEWKEDILKEWNSYKKLFLTPEPERCQATPHAHNLGIRHENDTPEPEYCEKSVSARGLQAKKEHPDEYYKCTKCGTDNWGFAYWCVLCGTYAPKAPAPVKETK